MITRLFLLIALMMASDGVLAASLTCDSIEYVGIRLNVTITDDQALMQQYTDDKPAAPSRSFVVHEEFNNGVRQFIGDDFELAERPCTQGTAYQWCLAAPSVKPSFLRSFNCEDLN